MKTRCKWADSIPELAEYHDKEWGVPIHDDFLLFEHLSLGGAQAGLSWLTILKRRAGYKEAFADFDPQIVAQYTPEKIEVLLRDPGIIRNQQKVNSVVNNAALILEIINEFGPHSIPVEKKYFNSKVPLGVSINLFVVALLIVLMCSPVFSAIFFKFKGVKGPFSIRRNFF